VIALSAFATIVSAAAEPTAAAKMFAVLIQRGRRATRTVLTIATREATVARHAITVVVRITTPSRRNRRVSQYQWRRRRANAVGSITKGAAAPGHRVDRNRPVAKRATITVNVLRMMTPTVMVLGAMNAMPDVTSDRRAHQRRAPRARAKRKKKRDGFWTDTVSMS
jgi:hypothetical protein